MSKVTEVVEAVRKLAEANPDFVYHKPVGSERCRYTNESSRTGSCIVGKAILEITPQIHKDHVYDSLASFDSQARAVSAPEVVSELMNVTEQDEKLLDWLDMVQASQDWGLPWSVSVYEADHPVDE